MQLKQAEQILKAAGYTVKREGKWQPRSFLMEGEQMKAISRAAKAQGIPMKEAAYQAFSQWLDEQPTKARLKQSGPKSKRSVTKGRDKVS